MPSKPASGTQTGQGVKSLRGMPPPISTPTVSRYSSKQIHTSLALGFPLGSFQNPGAEGVLPPSVMSL